MTSSEVSTLLESAARRVQPGPPPVADVVRTARRIRRRRTLAVTTATVAAVVAVVGTTVVFRTTGGSAPDRSLASPAPVEAPLEAALEAPPGMRPVGLGPVAIAVPEDWGTNRIHCRTPREDTVVVDVADFQACLYPRDAGIESVELTSGEPRVDFRADETVTVDGLEAQRQRTTCEPRATLPDRRSRLCTGTMFFPAERVSVRVESSTGPAEVDALLAQVRILDDHVGVPGFRTIVDSSAERPLGPYRDRLATLGLNAEVRTRIVSPGIPAGRVEAVAPAPGTVLPRAGTVIVTVTAHAEPPERARPRCGLDVSALRAGPIHDYDPVRTPQEYAEQAGLVVRARLSRVLEGFAVDHGTDRRHHLVVEFAVTDVIRGDEPDLVRNGSLYVVIDQGPSAAGTGLPAAGIETFRRALPAGTDAILFVSRFEPAYFNDSAITEIPEVPAMPPGAPLVGAGIQGMVLDDCGALVGGHEDLAGPGWTRFTTLDQLQAALARKE